MVKVKIELEKDNFKALIEHKQEFWFVKKFYKKKLMERHIYEDQMDAVREGEAWVHRIKQEKISKKS